MVILGRLSLTASFPLCLRLRHHISRVFFPLPISPHLLDTISCLFSSRHLFFETKYLCYYCSTSTDLADITLLSAWESFAQKMDGQSLSLRFPTPHELYTSPFDNRKVTGP